MFCLIMLFLLKKVMLVSFVLPLAFLTGLYTGVLTCSVAYYSVQGRHASSCFIDFGIASDKVTYWKLFLELILKFMHLVNIVWPFPVLSKNCATVSCLYCLMIAPCALSLAADGHMMCSFLLQS
jgi:hypothetical protein